MNIFKEIKNSGIDIFINYHPKVIDFKRKSKELHKKLKKEKSLMQCQEMVAKENGFNNWHHFIIMIKKYYEKDVQSNFLVTQNVVKNSNNLLLGHDINLNNYKWQDEESMRTHQLIITDKHHEYNLFLMKQIIQNHKQLIVINPNKESINDIINEAIKNNREKDIKVFNFSNDKNFEKYQCFLNNNINLSSAVLTEIFLHLSKAKKEPYDQQYTMQLIMLISSIFMLLVHLKKEKNIVLDCNTIKEYIKFENLYTIYKSDDTIPMHIKNALKAYFNYLPDFYNASIKQSETTLGQYKRIQEDMLRIISFLETITYKADGIEWNSLFSVENKDIIIIYYNKDNPNKEKIDRLMIYLIKNVMFQHLSGTIENYSISNKVQLMDNQYLFLIDCYLAKGVSIVPGQARAIKLCISCSYSSVEDLTKNIEDDEEIKYVIGNFRTKIISNKNKAPILDIEPLVNVEIEEDMIIDNKSHENEEILWIIKNNECHQIDFYNIL